MAGLEVRIMVVYPTPTFHLDIAGAHAMMVEARLLISNLLGVCAAEETEQFNSALLRSAACCHVGQGLIDIRAPFVAPSCATRPTMNRQINI